MKPNGFDDSDLIAMVNRRRMEIGKRKAFVNVNVNVDVHRPDGGG